MAGYKSLCQGILLSFFLGGEERISSGDEGINVTCSMYLGIMLSSSEDDGQFCSNCYVYGVN